MTPEEYRAYRQERNAEMEEKAAELGMTVEEYREYLRSNDTEQV